MHLVFAFVLLILLPTTSLAVDLTGGRAAIFLDKEGTAKDLALVKFSREPGLVAQLPDPTTGISSLRINSNTANTGIVTLDPTRWKASGGGFVYRFPPKGNPPGGIVSIVFKSRATGGKLIIKARGDGYGVNAISGPVNFVQIEFWVDTTLYTGRFSALPETERFNTAERVLLAGRNISTGPNAGHELLEPGDSSSFVVWLTLSLTTEEFDAIDSPPGWVRNQPRESVGQGGRFFRSPDGQFDGDFSVQQMFGTVWLHAATVVSIDGPLDGEGLLQATTVHKYHEPAYYAGRSVTILTSPESERYILVSRDAQRTSDEPTIPTGWTLEVIPLYTDVSFLLPEFTTVIRTDNEDSFQGPVPTDIVF